MSAPGSGSADAPTPDAPTPEPGTPTGADPAPLRSLGAISVSAEAPSLVGGDKPQLLTPIQKFAARFAIGVGSLIAGILLLLLYSWLHPRIALPPPPPGPGGTPQWDAYLKEARELGDIETARLKSVFDLTVSTALLPILTTLLGFLLGRASRD